MRHARTFFLLLCISLLPSVVAHGQSAPGTSAAVADRVETVQFKSDLMNKTLPYNVALPLDYSSAAASRTRYPVLYLLHGLSGHYTDWLSRSKLANYAAQYRLIIVTPEGNNGWYTDSPVVPSDKYESYIVQELIPDVQRRYRTLATRDARAIAGLSMGGYGALKFGLKYPEMFALAASMSGALGAASWTENELRLFGPALARSVTNAFGAAADSPTRNSNDLYKLARAVPAEKFSALPFFYLDCGTEDRLITFNRSLADLFLERKIPHEYRELPGTHSWPYWDAQVREVLQLAARKLPALQATALMNARLHHVRRTQQH